MLPRMMLRLLLIFEVGGREWESEVGLCFWDGRGRCGRKILRVRTA